MKALSIRQPWAWLIVNGYKDVENRSWQTKYRGRLYVHASGTHVRKASSYRLVQELGTIEQAARYGRDHYVHFETDGCIVGEVTLMNVLWGQDSPWAEPGKYHWILANPVAYEAPIPYKGRLGLFDVPDADAGRGA